MAHAHDDDWRRSMTPDDPPADDSADAGVATFELTAADGLRVALHDLGGHGPAVLYSHATGFHGYVWIPMARQLAGRFHGYAIDYRGHGDSQRPDGDHVDWRGYVDDAAAAVAEIDRRVSGRPRFAVGHSMGGTAVMVLEAEQPGTFDAIAVYEPIAFDPSQMPDRTAARLTIAEGARRRRRTFASLADAEANYAAKPPLADMTNEVRRLYVGHGMRDNGDGTVSLKCEPEHEARTFEGNASLPVWSRLESVRCPVLVIGGTLTDPGPSAMVAPLVERLPNATHCHLEQLRHLGPLQDPVAVAAVVGEFFASTVAGAGGRLPHSVTPHPYDDGHG